MDYKEIIDNLQLEDIKHLLQVLEVPFRETDTALIMPTVCHNESIEGASWKLYYYKNNHLFYCYTNCEAMSIFKFLRNFYETRQIEYDWYQDIYLAIKNCSSYNKIEGFQKPIYKSLKERYSQQRKVKQLPQYDNGVLGCFTKIYPTEWLEDGISKSAMDKFNILYSISQNKIIIPHYDIDERLVGIRGRALNDWEVENVGKYMPVQIENRWYKHPLSMNLYGLNFNKDNIKNTGVCFLVESEKAVLQADSFSIPNCTAAVCGSNLNKYQLNILLKACQPKEIVICFDQEEEKGKEKYFNKLYAICKKYEQYANFSFIYDRWGLLELKQSPTDCGEEIFKKLIEKRVKVK